MSRQTNFSYRDLEQGYDTPSHTLPTILETRQQITQALTHLHNLRANHLQPAQQSLLNSTSTTDDQSARRTLDAIEADIHETFRQVRRLVDALKQPEIAGARDPRAKAQIDATRNQVQGEIRDWYRAQTEFDRALREQVRRRYEIAHPELEEGEVEEGVRGVLAGEMVFQVNGARTRNAKDAQAAVMERSAAIRKIESELTVLNELSREVAELVHRQEAVVEKVEEDASDAVVALKKANTEMGHAAVSLRNARKYKWWILLVCVLIIAIIVAACVGWCKATDHC
ncbi:t-SNARE [Aspergillus avenaceus]|uniref:t-SNARE n=1 Tax=Aspergillus avenaceus TaxID=36643 RepID=A0A5N6TZX8_ASPAV|nr:t-SNARE [Aspergillus avenaceus]